MSNEAIKMSIEHTNMVHIAHGIYALRNWFCLRLQKFPEVDAARNFSIHFHRVYHDYPQSNCNYREFVCWILFFFVSLIKTKCLRFEKKNTVLIYYYKSRTKFLVCFKLMEQQKPVKMTVNIVYCVKSSGQQHNFQSMWVSNVHEYVRLWRKVCFFVVTVLFVCKQCLTCIHMWRGPNLS